jgi:hypothetical protein
MIALKGVVGLRYLDTTALLPTTTNDNTLKKNNGMLESHAQKQNHWKDKTTKYVHIYVYGVYSRLGTTTKTMTPFCPMS